MLVQCPMSILKINYLLKFRSSHHWNVDTISSCNSGKRDKTASKRRQGLNHGVEAQSCNQGATGSRHITGTKGRHGDRRIATKNKNKYGLNFISWLRKIR